MPNASKMLLLLCSVLSFMVRAQSPETRKEIEKLSEQALEHSKQYRFKESLSVSREALAKALEAKDYEMVSSVYNIIGGNFEDLGEIGNAVEYYNKGLKYAGMAKSDHMRSVLYNNLGTIYYYEKDNPKRGSEFYHKSLDFARNSKDTYGMLFTEINLALTYYDMGKPEKGLKHLEYVNQHNPKYGDPETQTLVHIVNANYADYLKKPQEAHKYFALALASGKKTPHEEAWAYEDYARFLSRQGDYETAYQYLLKKNKIEDSIFGSEKINKASTEGLNIELDEYRRAFSKMEAQNEVQTMSLQKSRLIQILFIAVTLVLLVLLYSLLRNYRFKQRHNRILTENNQLLAAAKEKAEEASRAKSQFVSTISHELRTPLYGVVGITNMLAEEHRELSNSPHLNSLRFSARYLLSLVNDVLQINKIEENRLVLERQVFNLADEIHTIHDSLKFLAMRNHNEISVEIDPEIPEMLIGDKLRLAQILINLMSNALKFTRNGKVWISARRIEVSGNRHLIAFEIRDNGIGIAKSDQEKIFEKFVQIDRNTSDYQGTGLGLAIVKRLLFVFDSEIHLESAPGAGTAFSFTIGFVHDQDESVRIINDIEVDLTSGQTLHVLVVEDNKINQVVTRKIIESNNYRCTVVDDGMAAISILDTESFDVVLMDINMPGLNGFETSRHIRSKGIQTPIIALTAFDKDEIGEEAIAAGMNDIIVKPFEPVKLFRLINTLAFK